MHRNHSRRACITAGIVRRHAGRSIRRSACPRSGPRLCTRSGSRGSSPGVRAAALVHMRAARARCAAADQHSGRMCTCTDAVTTHARLLDVGLSRRGISGRRAATDRCSGFAAGCTPAMRRASRSGRPRRMAARWPASPPRDTRVCGPSRDEREIHVWLGGHGHAYAHDGCSCVEHWDDGPATDAFGVPSVPRILRQMLACRGVEEFFVALESALRQGLITDAGLAWLRSTTNAHGPRRHRFRSPRCRQRTRIAAEVAPTPSPVADPGTGGDRLGRDRRLPHRRPTHPGSGRKDEPPRRLPHGTKTSSATRTRRRGAT